MRTFEALLKEGTGILEKSGNQEAGLDAWLLLEYTINKNRAWYYAHMGAPAAEQEADRYLKLCRRRARHIPLQHLTQQAFFMGYEFYVDEHVLIPRQDTEILAEEALRCLKELESPRILDMCTGSGCILLSILAEKQGCTGIGADISPEALAVAKRNAVSLGVQKRAVFAESDIFTGKYFQEKDGKEPGKYDILISNPPYIPTGEMQGLMEEVRLHDPGLALDGREDGLYFYRVITAQSRRYLKPGGWLLYEIGCSQGAKVSDMMKAVGFQRVAVKQDLSGLDRVVMGQSPAEI